MNIQEIKSYINREPYYETDNGVLYCMDCIDIMKCIPDKAIDLILTDPPYGLNKKIHDGGTWATHKKYDDALKWDYKLRKEYFDEMDRIAKFQIIWGGSYYTDILPVSRCWLGWAKPRFTTMSELELAWTNFDKPSKFYYCARVCNSIHPTQKPIRLFSWVLNNYSKNDYLILDPFMGSGTTAVVCEMLGRKWIGVEVSEKYCEMTKNRIKENSHEQ